MLLIILPLILLLIAALVAAGVYVHLRKVMREQKNFERGLKMVPLLIHLPPRSSDTEIGSRDNRDVLDETISKAETLYDIISSTTQKGFKSNFYGQRHFGLEIVGIKGFVHFYAAVPIALVEVVQQAILSAYPDARLEEVVEHNIFSPVGGADATMGGELVLKEDYSQPIATFQELKRDTMQSMLNSLSTLEKDDGAGIQLLMRPAQEDWRKPAIEKAKSKRNNEKKSKSGLSSFTSLENWAKWLAQIGTAPFKVPEDSGGGDKKSEDSKPLSGLDQALVDAIEEKTRHAGYEVLVRVVASSSTPQRAQSILNSLVATFALFDSPGKNGFKFVPAKDIDSFITAYIMRFFPPETNENVLNSIELATLFHFPDQNTIPTTQLERQASKQVDGPRNVPEEGMLLGYNVFRGTKKKINIDVNDRRRHIYVVGQTGTGKSTFLENLALQDMLDGGGFAFIDPHGDTAEKLLAMVPKERTEDVIYFCPADMEYPLGLNLFEFETPDEQDFLIQEAINMLYKLYDPQHQGIIGPRYEHWFRMASKTIMADPAGATFIDIPKVFTDNQYAKDKLKFVKDRAVLDFWNKEMAQTSDYHKSEVLGWFVSKFGAFMANDMMRNIIGQTKSSFNLRDIMDNKKILLVNLSKGRSGELNSKLLGMIFVMKFQAAAMSRASIPEDQRVDFSLYVDEFQNFSTDSFADILSEARKYRLKLIIANQFTTQLTDEIRDAVFGNVGTIIAFRVGTQDADFLAKQFSPSFTTDDLQRVPNYNAIVRMLISGVPTQPFSMAGLPPLGNPNKELADALKQLSAAKHGRPRAIVEKEIFDRLGSSGPEQPVSKPTAGRMGGAPATGAGGAGAQGTPAPQRGTGSFLDEWNFKQKTNSFKAPSSPFKKPGAQTGPQAGAAGQTGTMGMGTMPTQTPYGTPAGPYVAQNGYATSPPAGQPVQAYQMQPQSNVQQYPQNPYAQTPPQAPQQYAQTHTAHSTHPSYQASQTYPPHAAQPQQQAP